MDGSVQLMHVYFLASELELEMSVLKAFWESLLRFHAFILLTQLDCEFHKGDSSSLIAYIFSLPIIIREYREVLNKCDQMSKVFGSPFLV